MMPGLLWGMGYALNEVDSVEMLAGIAFGSAVDNGWVMPGGGLESWVGAGNTGRCHRLPCRLPIAIIALSRKMVT